MREIFLEGGYLSYRLAPGGTCEIVDIEVSSDVRRTGLGRRMLKQLIDEAGPKTKIVYAFSRASNRIAADWYKAMGFRAISVSGMYADEDGAATLWIKRMMSCLYVANFGDDNPGQDERHIAAALQRACVHLAFIPESNSPQDVLQYQRSSPVGDFDFILVAKGNLAGDATGSGLAWLCQHAEIPVVSWSFDKYAKFTERRRDWLLRVAPSLSLMLVTDPEIHDEFSGAEWLGHVHVLRQGIAREFVCPLPEGPLPPPLIRFAHVGSVYGERQNWLAELMRFGVDVQVIQGVYGQPLGRLLQTVACVLGPPWPTGKMYWSNRVYQVLGQGGYFITPFSCLALDGFDSNVIRWCDDTKNQADVALEMIQPRHNEHRESVRRAAQKFILERHTYDHRIPAFLARVETMLEQRHA